MFKNHLIIALRSLGRGKIYTFLNVAGLSAGLACFALIAAWVINELSYDQHYADHERIYRLAGTVTTGSEAFSQAVTSPPMAAALINDFPEVENATRIDENDCIVRRGEKQFLEDDVLFVDQSFFDIFSFQLSAGSQSTALRAPFTVVLTETMAEKYFGSENPVGQEIILFVYDRDGRGASYKVTGVIPDPPPNSHFTFNFLGSFATFDALVPDLHTNRAAWFWNRYYTYLLLREGSDPAQLTAKLPAFADQHMGERMAEMQMFYDFQLQPVSNIHLGSDLRYEIRPTGNVNAVYIFISIGIFILLIACINYMNLATARSLHRAREVGVKKVAGAGRTQLIRQFLTESLLVAFISFIFALVLIELAQPLFERLIEKEISSLYSSTIVFLLLAATIFTGFFSGLYPAFVISGFQPIDALRGTLKSSASGVALRKGLVIFQFTISIILLFGIGVIHSQMTFISEKDLGFDQESLLVLEVNGFAEVQTGIESFRNELLQNASISGLTVSRGLIVHGLGNAHAETIDGQGNPVSSSIYRLGVDHHFLPVYGMDILAGRNFEIALASDSVGGFVLNEAAVKAFGWGDAPSAIGKPFRRGDREGQVIGVVKDFHFASLQERIDPVAITISPRGRFSRITVRINTANIPATIGLVEAAWQQHFPEALFRYSFLDERLGHQYRSERVFRQLFSAFVAISLLIACLGLFGLAAYATRQRFKEIGIRKVLGASVAEIIVLLSADFLKLVAVAFLIAAPLGYFIMDRWLSGFAYRISIGWELFLFSGGLALLIALLTVSYQAIKTALTNPVDALRYE